MRIAQEGGGVLFTNKPRQFREALAASTTEPLLVPSVFDAMSAQLAARSGFQAAWIGSSGVTNTLMGMPDVGYVNLTDMDFIVRKAVASCDIPLLVDVDDGYGYALNVIHTVQTMEAAGSAGVMIEDQRNPRTPYEGTTAVLSANEAVGKIAAAADARKNPDFFIFARTDSAWTDGLNAAIDRGNRFSEAGADALYVTGVFSLENLAQIKREVKIPHLMWTNPGRGRSAATLAEISEMGFDMHALGSADATRATALALIDFFDHLYAGGLQAERAYREKWVGTPVEDWSTFTGFPNFRELEKKYLAEAEYRARYLSGNKPEWPK